VPSSPRRLRNSDFITSCPPEIRWTFKYATPNNSRNANALKIKKGGRGEASTRVSYKHAGVTLQTDISRKRRVMKRKNQSGRVEKW
jgi:hypothetical protein